MSPDESKAASVTVVGSLNVDYLARVSRHPSPGETVAAADLETIFGGKGANQAVAAARQKAGVSLIGAVGRDEMGAAYIEYLKREGIDTSRILETPVAATGSAFICVDEEGENTIVIASGANGFTGPEHVRAVDKGISESGALLAQFEVSLSAVVEAIKIANRAGVRAIVNPSPVRQTFPWQDVAIDCLLVNEHEAEQLFEFAPAGRRDCETMTSLKKEFNVRTVIVTRGRRSTLAFAEDEFIESPTLPVLPVDTVGAGDAFAGCLAARLAGGETLADAIRAANCAGALTTLGAGAQDPIPDRDQVDEACERLA